MGVVDPAKVTRIALQNAASIAAMMLTADVMVTDLPEDEGGPGRGRVDRGVTSTAVQGSKFNVQSERPDNGAEARV